MHFLHSQFFESEFMLSTWIRRNGWILAIGIKEFHQALNRSLSLYAFKNSNTNSSASPHINFTHFAPMQTVHCLIIFLSVCSYVPSTFGLLRHAYPQLWTGVYDCREHLYRIFENYINIWFFLLVDSMKTLLSNIVVSSDRLCLFLRLAVHVRPFIDYL